MTEAAYLAARFSRRWELRERARELAVLRIENTATWIEQASDEINREHAERDLADIRRADTLILVGSPGNRAGSMFEFGYAWSKRKRCIVVARQPGSIFSTLPGVEHYGSWNALLAVLTAEGLVAA